jgi:hypothetical protein
LNVDGVGGGGGGGGREREQHIEGAAIDSTRYRYIEVHL